MEIVSANFYLRDGSRSRRLRRRWLLRGEGAKLTKALSYDCVVAHNVTFGDSTTSEEVGFGCDVVAFCESAVGRESVQAEDIQPCVELKFSGIAFYVGEHPHRKQVKWCEFLLLLPDGRILGAPLFEKPHWARPNE